MRRRVLVHADYQALSRLLEAAGLDPEFWGTDDVITMWRWGYSLERMVATALRHEGKTDRRSA